MVVNMCVFVVFLFRLCCACCTIYAGCQVVIQHSHSHTSRLYWFSSSSAASVWGRSYSMALFLETDEQTFLCHGRQQLCSTESARGSMRKALSAIFVTPASRRLDVISSENQQDTELSWSFCHRSLNYFLKILRHCTWKWSHEARDESPAYEEK